MPSRLVSSWRVAAEPTSRVTIGFSAITDGSTEVALHHERIHTGELRDDQERGWRGCLDGLERWAARSV